MTRILKRAVSFDAASLLTVDAATLIPTNEVVGTRLGVSNDVDPQMLRFIEIELREPGFS